MVNNVENLKQYLLGNLSDEKTEVIDMNIISDKNLEEKLLIAEHLLIEDYLEESLDPGEIKLFYKNFLISPEREKQIAHIAGLKKYAGNVSSEELNAENALDDQENFIQKLGKFLTLQPAKAVFAVLIIGIFVGAVWIAYLNSSGVNELSPLEQEFAKLNKDDFGQLGKYENFPNLSLVSGSSRGADASIKLSKNGIADKVLFRLALPSGIGAEKVFRIEFEQNNAVVFAQNEIRAYPNPHGKEFRFLVPASKLNKGDYLIKAFGEKKSEIVYSFSVE